MSKQKTKKQNPQQAFNEFLFNAMMDKLRAIELYEKEVASYSNQLSVHIKDHRKNDLLPQFTELCKKVEGMRFRIDVLDNQGSHTCHNLAALEEDRKRIIELEKYKQTLIQRLNLGTEAIDRIDAIELKIKEQRGDYHDHIRQLVTENEAAHFEMKKRYDMMESADCANLERLNKINDAAREASNAQAREILKMQEQIKGLENRLSRAQDMIAEMHKGGPITEKKPSDKSCKDCKHGDGAYCNHETPSHCSHYEQWEQKENKPAGRPKKKV